MLVSGPSKRTWWPVLERCSKSRASVRVTPSTFGKKFSVIIAIRITKQNKKKNYRRGERGKERKWNLTCELMKKKKVCFKGEMYQQLPLHCHCCNTFSMTLFFFLVFFYMYFVGDTRGNSSCFYIKVVCRWSHNSCTLVANVFFCLFKADAMNLL